MEKVKENAVVRKAYPLMSDKSSRIFERALDRG